MHLFSTRLTFQNLYMLPNVFACAQLCISSFACKLLCRHSTLIAEVNSCINFIFCITITLLYLNKFRGILCSLLLEGLHSELYCSWCFAGWGTQNISLYIVQKIFSCHLGSSGSCWVSLQIEFRWSRCWGAWAVLHHYITAHEQTQQNYVCYFHFFDVFLASRGTSFGVILSSLQLVLCHVASVKHLPLIIIVQIIYFLVLWDQQAHSESVWKQEFHWSQC